MGVELFSTLTKSGLQTSKKWGRSRPTVYLQMATCNWHAAAPEKWGYQNSIVHYTAGALP